VQAEEGEQEEEEEHAEEGEQEEEEEQKEEEEEGQEEENEQEDEEEAVGAFLRRQSAPSVYLNNVIRRSFHGARWQVHRPFHLTASLPASLRRSVLTAVSDSHCVQHVETENIDIKV